MSLNRVALSGRLTRDPELRYSTNGVAIASVGLACNRSQKDESGDYICDFFNLVAWRNTAEFMHRYVGKGNRVNVDGRLQTRSWVDQTTGQKRSVVEIVVDNVEPIDWKEDSGESEGEEADSFADEDRVAQAREAHRQQAQAQAQARPARRAEPQPQPVEEYADDEVDPFASEDEDTMPVQAEVRQPARRQPVGAR